jgi:hypothetical protein
MVGLNYFRLKCLTEGSASAIMLLYMVTVRTYFMMQNRKEWWRGQNAATGIG